MPVDMLSDYGEDDEKRRKRVKKPADHEGAVEHVPMPELLNWVQKRLQGEHDKRGYLADYGRK